MGEIIQFPNANQTENEPTGWEKVAESSEEASFDSLADLPEFQESATEESIITQENPTESPASITETTSVTLDKAEPSLDQQLEDRVQKLNQSERKLEVQNLMREYEYYIEKRNELNQQIAEDPSLSTNPEYLAEKQYVVCTLAVDKDRFEALNDPENADVLPADLYGKILERYNHILETASNQMSPKMRAEYQQQANILENIITNSTSRAKIEKSFEQPVSSDDTSDSLGALPGDVIS